MHHQTTYLAAVILAGQIANGAYIPKRDPQVHFTYDPLPTFSYEPLVTVTNCETVTWTPTHFSYDPTTTPPPAAKMARRDNTEVETVIVTKTLTKVVGFNPSSSTQAVANQNSPAKPSSNVIHRTEAESPNPTAIPSAFRTMPFSNTSSTVIHRTKAESPNPTAIPSAFRTTPLSSALNSTTVIHRTKAESPNPTAIPSAFRTSPFSGSAVIHRTEAESPNPTAVPSAFPTKPLTTLSTQTRSMISITPLQSTTVDGGETYVPATSKSSSTQRKSSTTAFDELWTHTSSTVSTSTSTSSAFEYPYPDTTTTKSAKATNTHCAYPYPGCDD